MATQTHRLTATPLDDSFRLLADSIPQLVWVAGRDGGVEFVNRRWCRFTGHSADAATGLGWEAVIHPDDLDATRSRWAAAVAEGKAGEYEERVRRHDGVYRWFLVRFEPYRDAKGEVVCWFGTATDIDERKRAVDAERQYSEERFRRLVEAAHDGIGEIDLDGRLVYVNDRMAAMLGYLPDEMIGRPVFEFAFEADHGVAKEHMEQRSRGLRRSFEWRFRHKDGSEVWTLAGAAPLFDPDGKHVGSVGIFSELTARRAAVEKLRMSEERFRTSVESLLDCFAIFSAVRDGLGRISDFRIEYVNQAVCRDNAISREALIGKNLLELRPIHRNTGLFDAYCRVVNSGEPLSREMEFFEGERDGEPIGRWMNIRANRLADGFVVAWQDVTERKRLETSFRELADAAPAILWETEPAGSCTFLSRGWTEFTGQETGDGLGYGWAEIVDPADRERVRASFFGANAERAPFQLEFRLQRPGGGSRWVLAAGRPRFDRHGAFQGYAGSIVNIDEHKQADARLRENEQRMRLAAEVARVGTFEWDIRSDVNLWTPELEAIYGLPPGSFAGSYEAWRACVHPDDIEAAEAAVAESLETGQFGAEWRIFWPDGSIRWVEGRGWVFHDESGEPLRMIGVNFDITDRRHADDALREASERKDAFLAVLAHELRNPLGPVRNAAGILTRVGQDNELIRQATQVIERQVSHMARLTDDLLDVSRIARGQIRLRTETVDLGEILRQTAEDYRATLEGDAGLALVLDIPGEPVWAVADPVRLAQAIGNLLHNAGKFTDAGGSVRVALRQSGGTATVAVSDDGRGMSRDMLARLFEPFSQADDSLDRSSGGLGLGLALVKGLVDLHDGSVVAHSDGLGHGSAFTLTLPLGLPPAARAPARQPVTGQPRGLDILIVEDNVDAAISLQALLKLDGHQVTVAADGASGVAAARSSRPDVVLCDIGLPGGMDGCAVARALRAERVFDAVRLVAVTGYGQDEDRQRSTDAGFDLHLLKPIDLGQLSKLLAEFAAR